MDSSFGVRLTPEQLLFVPLIIGLVQTVKDIPALAFLRDWLPLVILALCEAAAHAMQWPNATVSGLALGLMVLGSWKAGTTTTSAIAKRQSGGTLTIPTVER